MVNEHLFSLLYCGGDETNVNNSEEKLSSVLPTGLVSQETLTLLNSLGKGSIDEKLKRRYFIDHNNKTTTW